MTESAIEFDHVWKKFRKGERYDSLRDLIPAFAHDLFSRNGRELKEREFWALKDVSFAVKRGEAIGVIGPNGAGKSTVLKMISNIIKPTKGTVKANGRLSALIEVGAGFHYELTGRENIYLNGSILGMTRQEIDSNLDEIIKFSGIGDFIDTPVKRYSSGMYARLGFSVAAHVNPDILLVDEVLSVGDALFRRKCIRRMQELVERNVAVLFVSHNVELVKQFCSRCLVLSRGNGEFFGPVEEAIDVYMRLLHTGGMSYEQIPATNGNLGKIREVIITDGNGSPIHQVDSAGAVSVVINYELHEPVEKPALAILLLLPSGQQVVHCDTLQDNVQLDGRPGTYTARLNINCINLCPNNYPLMVRLLNVDGSLIDGYESHLVVRGQAQFGALITVEHHWVAAR